MEETTSTWTETDSRDFLDLAEIAVPARGEQIETLLSLIPAEADEEFAVADLCCGEGLFAARLLERYTRARIMALDGSELMRNKAASRLAAYGGYR